MITSNLKYRRILISTFRKARIQQSIPRIELALNSVLAMPHPTRESKFVEMSCWLKKNNITF
jgi:hypothetical protein